MSFDGAPFGDPLVWFNDSFGRASALESFDASRAALATSDTAGRPSVRFVLVRRFDARGFAFFTNRESQKGRELAENPRAALVFHWHSIGEQVRIQGAVELTSDSESDAYFASRPRSSQVSAWSSAQSEPIESRAVLERRYSELEARFAGQATLPRPSYWGGYRIVPARIEFWRDREGRLHDRWCFDRDRDAWRCRRLQP